MEKILAILVSLVGSLAWFQGYAAYLDKESLQAPGPLPALPPDCGDKYVSYQEAARLIKACQIPVLFQSHEGPVLLQLKDGSSVCVKQPHIDLLPRLAATVCPQSPAVVLLE